MEANTKKARKRNDSHGCRSTMVGHSTVSYRRSCGYLTFDMEKPMKCKCGKPGKIFARGVQYCSDCFAQDNPQTPPCPHGSLNMADCIYCSGGFVV